MKARASMRLMGSVEQRTNKKKETVESGISLNSVAKLIIIRAEGWGTLVQPIEIQIRAGVRHILTASKAVMYESSKNGRLLVHENPHLFRGGMVCTIVPPNNLKQGCILHTYTVHSRTLHDHMKFIIHNML